VNNVYEREMCLKTKKKRENLRKMKIENKKQDASLKVVLDMYPKSDLI
jgi:hypothetical protein